MAQGIQLQVSVNDREVRQAFTRLMTRVLDRRPALDAIGASLQSSTRHRFETKTDPEGNPWTPLKESTRRQYERIGAQGSLLMRTFPSRRGASRGSLSYRLFDSITHKATNDAVAVGSNARFGEFSRAAIHQLGGKPGMAPAAIPARPFLGISADDQREIGLILMRHLGGAL